MGTDMKKLLISLLALLVSSAVSAGTQQIKAVVGMAKAISSSYTDDFESTLNGGWTQVTSTGALDAQSVTTTSGSAVSTVYNTYAAALYTGATFDNNQYSEVVLGATALGNANIGPLVRMSGDDGYGAYCASTTACAIYITTDGVSTTLGSAFTDLSISSAPTIRLEASGNTLTIKVDGSTIGSRTDSTYSSGSVGLRTYSNNAAKGFLSYSGGSL